MARNPRHKAWMIVVAAAAIVVPLAIALPLSASSDGGMPANKTTAAGSSLQMLSPDFADNDQGTTILTTSLRTSRTVDLLLEVNLECALWTEVTSSTDEQNPFGFGPLARAEAQLTVWVEVDGVPVTVDAADPDGKVVFCERVHEQEITDREDSSNITVRQYQESRQANSFSWWITDAGSGIHTVTVKADIQASNTEGSYADGAIGKRTIIVEPTRFANGA